MKKNFCDICKKELSGWEDMGDLKIRVTQSCGNDLARLKFSNGNYQGAEIKVDELCFSCVRKISTALYAALKPILESE